MNYYCRILVCGAFFASAGVNAQQDNSSASRPASPSGASAISNFGAANPTTSTGGLAAPTSVITDPSYKLSSGDQISVQVDNEPDFNCSQLIDRDGIVRLKVVGDTKLIGKTVREAERAIEELYVVRRILKKPAVNVVVTAFSPREVLVLGAVNSPGSVGFPRDAVSMDIVEVITRAGGFRPGAKSSEVRIRHKEPDGREISTSVDVESMMFGSGKRGEQRRANFPVTPGDIINVEMKLF